MIPYVRLLTLINDASDSYPQTTGAVEDGGLWNEGRALIDGALVVYDLDAPPAWLTPVLAARDEDGNTGDRFRMQALAGQTEQRIAERHHA